MLKIQPNTLCKNINCDKSPEGGRRLFYSCYYCVRVGNIRSTCCCDECQTEYEAQVIESRKGNREIDLFPDRTDMSKTEIQDLLRKPIEDVIEQTKEELKDYKEDIEVLGLAVVVDKINDNIHSSDLKYQSSESNDENISSFKGRRKRKE